MIAPIVDAEWVSANREDLVLADVRWYLDGRSGEEAYAQGHLPGAVFVDLDGCLSAPPGPDARNGRHPLPDPDAFATCLAAVGIGEGDIVIAYDDAGGTIAARLIWMLRAIGQDAALLDGGLAAWPEPLEAGGTTSRPAGRRASRPWPTDRLSSIDDAASAASAENVVIDGRDRARYLGGPDPVDPRSGHVPGALSVPGRENLDDNWRFLSPEALRSRFTRLGITDGAQVISYCGSGVTACHNLLAIEHAGLGIGRLYPGSWSQWSRDPARPVETAARNPGQADG